MALSVNRYLCFAAAFAPKPGQTILKIDGFAKSLNTSFDVILAKAGIQYFQIVLDACLRRACPCEGRGMTEIRIFHEFVKIEDLWMSLRSVLFKMARIPLRAGGLNIKSSI